MISAQQALDRLREGNQRYLTGRELKSLKVDATKREALAAGQHPVAIILTCSDARVPAEQIFDQGLGDLFVVRVAGNIAAPSQVGSIEYAAEQLGTRLVVVMGHSQCGAVSTTVDLLHEPDADLPPGVFSIIKRIRPCVEAVYQQNPELDRDTLICEAIRANVSASAKILRTESAVLERLIREDGLQVLCAEYSLKTGEVTFLD